MGRVFTNNLAYSSKYAKLNAHAALSFKYIYFIVNIVTFKKYDMVAPRLLLVIAY